MRLVGPFRCVGKDQVVGVAAGPPGLLELPLGEGVAEPAKEQAAAVVERHGQIQAGHNVPINRDAAGA